VTTRRTKVDRLLFESESLRLGEYAKMLVSGDAYRQRCAQRYFRDIAWELVDGRAGLSKAKAKRGGRKSGRTRQSKNSDRDARMHTAAARGVAQKTIASQHGVSTSTVSRVLKKPHTKR
jgi:hypothetical protein